MLAIPIRIRIIDYFPNLDFTNRIIFFIGYQKIAINESANAVKMPRIAAMTPPPIPGPMYKII